MVGKRCPTSFRFWVVLANAGGAYEVVFSSDKAQYGGNGSDCIEAVNAEKYNDTFGKEQKYIKINLPALSGVVIRRVKGRARRV